VSGRLCRFCSEYEVMHPDDDRCINCAYFGPGDPHGRKARTDEAEEESQTELVVDDLSRWLRPASRRRRQRG
jgi:hypothetical protein